MSKIKVVRQRDKRRRFLAWHPAKISEEALKCLKVVSALSGKEMREIASTAILEYCSKFLKDNFHKQNLSIGKKRRPLR